jgi:hypothetical protein
VRKNLQTFSHRFTNSELNIGYEMRKHLDRRPRQFDGCDLSRSILDPARRDGDASEKRF